MLLAATAAFGEPLRAEPASTPAPAATERPAERRGLGGHVLPALDRAVRVEPARRALGSGEEPITLTIVLARDDEQGFRRFLADVYDPRSPLHRRFLAPAELADRFGPSAATYDAVRSWLEREGFAVVQESSSRMTLTVAGTRGAAERAVGVTLDEYELGGRRFYANASDPRLPSEVAPHVLSVIGLSSLAAPARPSALVATDPALCGNVIDPAQRFACIYPHVAGAMIGGYLCFLGIYFILLTWELSAYALVAAPGAVAAGWPLFNQCIPGYPQGARRTLASGVGQKIGLLEFDSFHPSDVADFLAFYGLPASRLAQLSEVKLDGGSPVGAGESEVLLDISVAMTLAQDAQVVVYNGSPSTSFLSLFSKMVDDGMDVISNSWSYCEDQTTLADVQGLDALFMTAAAAGITVLNASGDTGSTCLDGSPFTVGVPADAPHALAVGGTSAVLGPGFTLAGETWWTGHGGFGVSRFFPRPSYQNGFTPSTGRSVPDVTAPADPATNGVNICQADRGGCPAPFKIGGTSMSAPVWAALVAVFNEARGSNLGFLNPALYAAAGAPAFRASGDFAHVGLGSPNAPSLSLALNGHTAGAGIDAGSSVSAAPASVPADGVSTSTVVVQIRDAKGNPVPGRTIALSQNAGGHATITALSSTTNVANGTAVFTVKDAVLEDVTLGAQDVTDGFALSQTAVVHFVSRPAASGSIGATPTSVPGGGSTTITVRLVDSDGNGVSGKKVMLSQGTGHSSVVPAGSATTTDSGGYVSFVAKDDLAETVTYQAVDVTDGKLPVPGNAVVAFGAAANSCSPLATPPVIAAGYAYTLWASGFETLTNGLCGAVSQGAWDEAGNLLLTHAVAQKVYRFPFAGGVAGPNEIAKYGPDATHGNLLPYPFGMAFSRDGKHLYQTRTYLHQTTGTIVEIDPSTGAALRTLANLYNVFDLAVDPISGDLFAAQGSVPPGNVYRIANPESQSPAVSVYAVTSTSNTGLAFAADGTLYTVGFWWSGVGGDNKEYLIRIDGTNSGTPGAWTKLVGLSTCGDWGPYVSPDETFALAHCDGSIRRIDLTQDPPVVTDFMTNMKYGNFLMTVGPDDCLYAGDAAGIYRVTESDGACHFGRAPGAPRIGLTPPTVSPNPALGTGVTFTAKLTDVASPAGTPIFFGVTGVNQTLAMVPADGSGAASFTLTGVRPGVDSVAASATAGGLLLASNAAAVSWAAGKHTTFVDVSESPTAGSQGAPSTLKARLRDLSLDPVVPLAGATVLFDVNGQTCQGVSDGAGVASCALAPLSQGDFTLEVTYAGDSGHLAASASVPFSVTGPLRGDANGSGVRDVTDVFYLINSLFAGGPPPATACRGDANGDGSVDVQDVFFLINFLFAGGPPPQPC